MKANRALAPIMVGVTGKRDLLGKEQAVRDSLRACFAHLDAQLPYSRKLLLTGLAAGADTIAAEVALERPNWRVIAVLPLDPGLFAQDFDDHRAALHKFLGDERVCKRVLCPLSDPEGRPFVAAALSRSPGKSNPDRSDHYEHAGLFIAERCALLIAVMPAIEEPRRVGGTARILSFRLRGPDAVARCIIRQSSELRPPIELDPPPCSPAWVIDLDAVDLHPNRPLRPVELRQPAGKGAADPDRLRIVRPKRRAAAFARSGSPIWIKAADRWIAKIGEAKLGRDLVDGLALATRIEMLNRRLTKTSKRRWQQDVEERARPDGGDAASGLDRLRRGVATLQRGVARKLRWVIGALVALFVAAVFCLELHIEEFAWPRLLYAYIGILVMILGLFIWAKLRRWQQYFEDYRAVAEALRVQLAWWDAGMHRPGQRVDQFFLAGTTGSLGLLRSAVRHLIDAIAIERNATSPPSPQSTDRWISKQIQYFSRSAPQRRSALAVIEDFSGLAFFAALGLWLAQLALIRVPWIEDWPRENRSSVFFYGFVAAGTIGLAVLLRTHQQTSLLTKRLAEVASNHFVKRRYGLQRGGGTVLSAIVAIMIGVLFSALICLLSAAFVSPDPISRKFITALVVTAAALIGAFLCYGHSLRHAIIAMAGAALFTGFCYLAAPFVSPDQLAHRLVAASAVTSAALAGALRYYAERRALDAESPRYEEALGTFRRAQRELAQYGGEVSGGVAPERDQIVLGLGRKALDETEAWVRAHRVRRLVPHP